MARSSSGSACIPFIITLGTMWVLRGIAFVATQGREHPRADVADRGDEGVARTRRRTLSGADVVDDRAHGRSAAIYLTRTVMGRHIFAFGGNLEASRFAGLSLSRFRSASSRVSGLTAGFAAFLGASFYGSASSGDAQGYELYVIASAVVGGASLIGGRAARSARCLARCSSCSSASRFARCTSTRTTSGS